ncbi:hypothetical protein GIY23_10450 [Allosaccharopolyspora coralli]|uniref:Uncharacterized protein n=1 Tax=Allosaccharopolyspora coralli TaxID=2665642 RepID=A0A5Q3Q6B8_9PSEU|nr:hypothetical protein [Allosaccharopolyspora coralli]QGK69883.1 hypothetical protein GIY23_10450 [Allosaccharopolyspora coralli]
MRELAWLLAGLPRPGSRIPVWQAMTCLNDALHRLGHLDVTYTQALLPLGVDVAANNHFTATHQWFKLTQHDAPQEISVSAHFSASAVRPDPTAFAEILAQKSLGVIEAAGADEAPAEAPDPGAFAGVLLADDELGALHLRCTAPEWSLDLAAYTTDLVADAALAFALRVPVSVSVLHAGTITGH